MHDEHTDASWLQGLLLDSFMRDEDGGGLRSLEHYQHEYSAYADAVKDFYEDYVGSKATNSDQPDENAWDEEHRHFGPFRTRATLGAGGQAVVYLAEDIRLSGRKVALKVLKEDPWDEDRRHRFRREAELMAMLQHAAICKVHEVGLDGSPPWIAMEYVEGQDLAHLLSRDAADNSGSTTVALADSHRQRDADTPEDRAAVRRVVEFIVDAAKAIDAAHEQGVIHRDLKPRNLMVRPDGTPVVLDFGLAREEASLHSTADAAGTPQYMSPEQVAGHRVRLDRRTDVYSMGVTLYECLTLRRPFQELSHSDLFLAIQQRPPRSVSKINRAVDRSLATIVDKAMAKARHHRYATMALFADDLTRWLTGQPVLARPVPPWTRTWMWCRRSPVVAASLLIALVSLASALFVSLDALSAARASEKQAEMGKRRAEEALMASRLPYLQREAERLWPRRDHRLALMDAWLRQARAALESEREFAARLAALRDRERGSARALTDTDLRSLHPDLFRYVDLLRLTRSRIHLKRESVQRELATKSGQMESRRNQRERAELSARIGQLERKRDRHAMELSAIDEDLAALLNDPRMTKESALDARDGDSAFDLVRVLANLSALRGLIAEVEERRLLASTLRQATVGRGRAAWAACLDRIRSSAAYGLQEPEVKARRANKLLAMGPQVGLVPLGENTETGLWEFWYQESGPRPPWVESAPLRGTIVLPDRKKRDAALDFGIVLVLLPGGRYTMGATPRPGRTNYDASADVTETSPHLVQVEPFFLSKYETTQAQWRRIMGWNRSERQRADAPPYEAVRLYPVTNVSWFDASTAGARWALRLPTEEEWEYGCRAGTTTPWWTGSDPRLVSKKAGNIGASLIGSIVPAGSFAPNQFGLCDTLGNVYEWCANREYSYPGCLAPPSPSGYRMKRGGAFQSETTGLDGARASARWPMNPHELSDLIGVRFARDIEVTE